MDTKELCAILCLLALALGWISGREASYGPLADRLAVCETGLAQCDRAATYCRARLETFEQWATEARDRMTKGRQVALPIGPVERRPRGR